MSRNRTIRGVALSLVTAARDEQITFLAASLAYYTFVSLVPLLLLVLVVATALGGEQLASDIVAQVGGALSPSGQGLLREALTGGSGRGGATIVGVGVLVWSALKIFRGLDIAFSQVYGTGTAKSFVGQVTDALVALLAVGAGLGVAVGVNVLIGVSGLPVVALLGTPALAVGLTITFLPLYLLLPDTDISIRQALPGAVLAGTGWTVLGAGFRVYAANATSFQLYGVIGGVLLLVTWFYIGSILLLLGGVLNAVLASDDRDDNRQLQQDRTRLSRQLMTDEGDGSTDREIDAELSELRADLEAIEDRTVHRDDLEADLKRYVRRRVRRGHAAGWGPYLVLLYGTAMTLGAFYYLGGGWAILAMIVIWLSTLGLYALMVLVGITVTAAGIPGRLREFVSNLR